MMRNKFTLKKLKSHSRQETPEPYRILLPLTNLDEARLLLPLADIIVQARQGSLTILIVVTVPEGQPLSVAAAQASRFREALGPLMVEHLKTTAQVKTVVRVPVEVWDGIWDTVSEERIDMLLTAWSTPALPDTVGQDLRDPRLVNPPCEMVVVRPVADVPVSTGWGAVKRILLPVRGGPHAGLALRVANALAHATDAIITLLHATDQEPRQAEEQLMGTFGPALRSLERLKRHTTVVNHTYDAIIEESLGHQVVVMGATTSQESLNTWSGPVLQRVAAGSNVTLVIVKERSTPVEETRLAFAAPFPRAFRGDRPVAVVVDQWFAENTFHSREFADMERLVELKDVQGVTISLGLPALNEAETVGNVIKTVKTALMDEVPLLDEMVLIDSGSVDYTREIAADLGIPVYIHQEILPQHGAYVGKGEALWKSLYVLKGDIVAWIDTDIKNIHPRFVYGVLGPMLRDPHIQYVKGFYRRPLREGDKLVAGGGGRVTELTARPFFNLFFPELSGLIQPLSGEYAGRRSALERLPFFTGYGVETGLLIDILDEYGLHAIAQVDLLKRIHHNQPLPSLSKMSFTIMQVVFSRLEKHRNIHLLEEANLTMNLVRYGPKRYYLEPMEIREFERPPMITVPEYLQKRSLDSGLVRETTAGIANHPA